MAKTEYVITVIDIYDRELIHWIVPKLTIGALKQIRFLTEQGYKITTKRLMDIK